RSTLAGAFALPGYPHPRFRDEGYRPLNGEYRWPLWTALDGVLFFDAGQVFQRYRGLRLGGVRHNVGAGVRVYGRDDAAGRVEVAFGPEGPRLIAQIGTLF